MDYVNTIYGGGKMQEQNEHILTELQKDLISDYYKAFRKNMSGVMHERQLDKVFKEHFDVLIPDYEERKNRISVIFTKELQERFREQLLNKTENMGE